MRKLFAILCCCAGLFAAETDTPPFLYKILSVQDWEDSQGEQFVELPAEDLDFIHFSREDQLERILSKYWANTPAVVLRVDVSKLPGDLVFETNPGGSAKYYHLYNGEVPLNAVVEITPWQ
jgi:uncharacterized protein (DUF952 family)